MPTWKCLHRRTSPFRGTGFDDLSTWPGFALAAASQCGAFPRDLIELELEERKLKCPGCRAQDKSQRRHWAAVAVVVLVTLLVGWRCG